MTAAIAPARWAQARAATAALAVGWRQHPSLVMLEDAFGRAAADDLAVAQARARAILSDVAWVRALIDPLVAALAADPLVDPPFKVSRDRVRLGAVLFDGAAARVTLGVTSARGLSAAPPAETIVATGHVAVTRYHHAGGARIRRWRADPLHDNFDQREAAPAVETAAVAPADGAVLIHDGRCEAQALVGASRDIVTVTIILRAGAAPLMREYAVADGRLLRAQSNDDGASRSAMLLTLLRVAGRADAAPAFAAASRDMAYHLRWSAMREWLALDARAALPRLAEMAADDPHAEVRAVAAATLATARAKLAACPA